MAVEERKCNCTPRESCKLANRCLEKNMVYQANVNIIDKAPRQLQERAQPENQGSKTPKIEYYVGLYSTTGKERLGNHYKAFIHRRYIMDTALSQFIWELKDKGLDYEIEWVLLAKASPYNPSNKTCNLCSKERFFILRKHWMATINKYNSLSSKCIHRRLTIYWSIFSLEIKNT